jgi:hypothetical protein
MNSRARWSRLAIRSARVRSLPSFRSALTSRGRSQSSVPKGQSRSDAALSAVLDGGSRRFKTGRREDGCFPQARSAAVTAPGRGRTVSGGALGRQPAVYLQVLRRSCQPGDGESPAGARLPDRACPPRRTSPVRAHVGSRAWTARGALRAPLNTYRKFSPIGNIRCRRLDAPGCRWSGGYYGTPTAVRRLATHVYGST